MGVLPLSAAKRSAPLVSHVHVGAVLADQQVHEMRGARYRPPNAEVYHTRRGHRLRTCRPVCPRRPRSHLWLPNAAGVLRVRVRVRTRGRKLRSISAGRLLSQISIATERPEDKPKDMSGEDVYVGRPWLFRHADLVACPQCPRMCLYGDLVEHMATACPARETRRTSARQEIDEHSSSGSRSGRGSRERRRSHRGRGGTGTGPSERGMLTIEMTATDPEDGAHDIGELMALLFGPEMMAGGGDASTAYETNLRLAELMGGNVRRGIRDVDAVSRVEPVARASHAAAATTPEGRCPICQCAFAELPREHGDRACMRRIFQCEHAFCDPCLRAWLRSATSCPVCRRDLTSSGGRRPSR